MSSRRFAWFLVGLAAVVHAPSFVRPLMDLDEASYASMACRLLDGGSPYRDAVENKFPAVFYVYKDVFALFGRYNMLAIHVAVTLVALATALVVGAIARRYAGPAAGRWAAGLYLVFSAGYYPKMLAGNTEMFAVLPGALAIWCYLRARDRHVAWYLAAGAFGALALLFKQVAIASFCAILADRALTGYREPLRALRDLALCALGFAAVFGAMVIHLRALGVLDDAVFWTWTYVLHYYLPAGSNDHGFLYNLATSFSLFALATSPLIYLAVRGRARGQSALYWWLGGNLGAALVGGRMYGHYFLLLVPALATVAGIGAARWFPDHPAARRRLTALVIVLAAAWLVAGFVFEGATSNAWSPEPDYRDAAAYVRAHTSRDDRLFVWGWFPALYQAADRCPSTRFVYTHLLAGASPEGIDRGHDVPEAWDMLLDDLDAAPPAYILDTSPGGYSSYHYPPELYPRLWSFIAGRYDVETTIAGVRLFRRR
ncbi:MAG TPA: glycosyltransferase family 39 protein [Kofleriaceae bacterium]|nr:glycosyltransferase family 39 protein [Kofleriaceae bacterium]